MEWAHQSRVCFVPHICLGCGRPDDLHQHRFGDRQGQDREKTARLLHLCIFATGNLRADMVRMQAVELETSLPNRYGCEIFLKLVYSD